LLNKSFVKKKRKPKLIITSEFYLVELVLLSKQKLWLVFKGISVVKKTFLKINIKIFC